MLFPSLGLTFIDHGGKVGIDEHRLDGFQLHRAAVAYASVSDGPSPRLAGAFPWPNERGVAEKSKVGKVKVRGPSTLYAPSYSLIVIIVIIHSFIHSISPSFAITTIIWPKLNRRRDEKGPGMDVRGERRRLVRSLLSGHWCQEYCGRL